MKMKTTLLAATALLALDLFAVNAKAADPVAAEEASFYVSLFGGASFLADVDADLNYDDPFGYDYSVETKMGYIIGGAIGVRSGTRSGPRSNFRMRAGRPMNSPQRA